MTIDSFSGQYRFLSNFYEHKTITLDTYQGYTVSGPTVEHVFQAAKCAHDVDANMVSTAHTATQAKALGRKFQMRDDWEIVKFTILADALAVKFRNGPLRDRLVATGDQQLIEGNNWGDRVYGVCDGEGENWLGRLLMLTRGRIVLGGDYD